MKKQHVCFHCGELYDAKKLVCPHCGADREHTYAGPPDELVVPGAMDDAGYEDFLESEGLSDKPKPRIGCGTGLYLFVSGLLWLLL